MALAARFDERFILSHSSSQRDYTRRQKRAVFRLILWPIANSTKLKWWLLRTEGTHDLLSLERWIDARQKRIEWVWGYELLQTPVDPKLRSRYKRNNGRFAIRSCTWTWRLRKPVREQLRASIRHCVQFDDDRLRHIVRSLQLAPGFRQVRADVFSLYAYIGSQSAKRNRPPPELPKTIRWVASKKHTTIPLSALVRRKMRGCEYWFPTALNSRDTRTATDTTECSNADQEKPSSGQEALDVIPEQRSVGSPGSTACEG